MHNLVGTVTESWFWQYFFSHFGWVDWALTVFLIVGMIIGLRNGAGRELPRLLETLVSLYVTFEYYSLLAEWITRETPCPESYAQVIAFALLGLVSWLLLRLIFEIAGKLIHLEVAAPFQWIGGLLIGGARYGVFFSLISYLLVLLPLDWIHRSYQVQSWSGQTLAQFAPQVHGWLKGFAIRTGLPTAGPGGV